MCCHLLLATCFIVIKSSGIELQRILNCLQTCDCNSAHFCDAADFLPPDSEAPAPSMIAQALAYYNLEEKYWNHQYCAACSVLARSTKCDHSAVIKSTCAYLAFVYASWNIEPVISISPRFGPAAPLRHRLHDPEDSTCQPALALGKGMSVSLVSS